MEINNNLSKSEYSAKQRDKTIVIPEKYLYRAITAILAGVCYINSLDGDFVHDDIFAIKNNGDVTGVSPLQDVFINDFWGKPMLSPTSHKSYRPLTILTFRWNYWLSDGSPWSFHVVNVTLHVMMTFLFTYACEVVVMLPTSCALTAGSLFAVHPIHTEAVAGIVGRADLLAGVFFLLAFIIYHWSINRHGPSTCSHHVFLFISMLCSAVAMLCKEHGITIMAVCVVYDTVLCWKRRNVSEIPVLRPYICRATTVTLTAFTLLSFRFWVMGGQLPSFIHQDNPASFADSFLTRCFSYSYIWYYNVRLLVAPLTLSYDWQVGSIPLVELPTDSRILATAGLVISLAALFIKCLRSLKVNSQYPDPILCGLLMTILPFLPASNLIFRVGFVIAERVLYIPSCGYCIIVAWGSYLLYQRLSATPFLRDAWTGLFIILIMAMAAKTWQQNQVWRSRESLFRSGIRAIPGNAKVHYNYANHLKDTGEIEQAVYHYKEAIRLYPSYASAHNNMGTILNNVTEAEYHYREALRLVPTHKGALINLGSSLFKRGEEKEGHDLIQKLLELDPSNTEGIIALAGMQVEMKEWEKADNNYKVAMVTDPENPEFLHHYGKYLYLKGDLEGAVVYYKRAFLIESKDPWTPMVNAAHTLNQLGRTYEAENILKGALSLRRDVSALDILGLIYYKQGRLAETVRTYREIQNLDPRHAHAMLHFSQVLAGMGESEKAENVLRDIIQYNPSNLDILTQMTNVLGQQGKHRQALSYLEDAIRLARQGDPETLHNLLFQQGNHYKDLRMYQHALKSYNETVQIKPNNAKAHLNIGAIFHLEVGIVEGYLAKARYHYNKVLQLEPDNSIAKDNLRKLQNLQKSSGKKQGSRK